MVTHNPGDFAQPQDVKVHLIEHHGKAVDETPPPWSSHTLVYRLSGPPEGYVSEPIGIEAKPGRVIKPKIEKAEIINPDPWGQKIGSDSNLFNVQIFDGPKTIEQIVKITGKPEGRVKGHVKYWTDKGRFKMDKKGLISFDPKSIPKKKEL